MKSKKHLIIIVAITMIAAVVSVQLCGCFSIAEFKKLFEEDGGAIGRKMDFLVQEINREINTIGSKAQDIEIARCVVDVKAEIEKIREQIQNIE